MRSGDGVAETVSEVIDRRHLIVHALLAARLDFLTGFHRAAWIKAGLKQPRQSSRRECLLHQDCPYAGDHLG